MQSPTLRAMLQQAIDRGDSLRDLQARAVDPQSGETAGKDLIASIVNGTANRIPVERHLRALAAALSVPYERVRRAAITQWLPSDEDADDAGTSDVKTTIDRLLGEVERLTGETAALHAQIERTERPKSA